MREWTAAAVAMLGCLGAAFAAETPECAVGAQAHADYALPRVAGAIEQARRLDVVVVGAGSSMLAGPGGTNLAYPARLEVILAKRWPGIATKVTADVKFRRTAAEMVEVFDKILMEAKPSLVVWQSGTVDAIKGVDPDEFRSTLDEGVEALQAGGADVILMNMQYSPRTESMIAVNAYADNMRVVSQQREVPLLDRFAIMKQWSELGTFDLTTPTTKLETAAKIHQCIAELLADEIHDGVKLARPKPNH
jgi:hypothetical protein